MENDSLNVFIPKKATKYTFKEEEIIYKENGEKNPLWVAYNGLVILETGAKGASQAIDFLIAISEPVSRTENIHEYQITSYSLYAATSVGLNTDQISNTLQKFAKNILPKSVKNFITDCTLSYGKLKLIRKNHMFFIEAVNESIFEFICNDEIIKGLIAEIFFEKFTIEIKNVEVAKKRCIDIDYPLLDEYDFMDNSLETSNDRLNIDLKPTCHIRSYQEICLNKMFGNGRARSGIIVLPCGSGKTLVGITAISTIKRSAIVLCTSAVSVEQWKQAIMQFSTLNGDKISRFTSDKKEWFETVNNKNDMGVLITTYSMLSFSGKRSFESQQIMEKIKSHDWGLMILDEVHVVPAQMFRKVLENVSHKCKLGLTATLVREDDKIEDLNFLIGPKLYEADWQDLSNKGHIAKVEGAEVWCDMTAEFYREYMVQDMAKRRLLAIMNPTKIQVCEYLIKKHEKRGDKIIVFSDSIVALKEYAIKMGKPYIYGPTSQIERMRILKQFQTNSKINTVFLSKVGDTSIDLPEATCLIQISSHFGSRRQEAQRLGRVLRAKKRNDPSFKSYFYSLVSKDTEEMYYSSKRQQFLIDQGYSFKTIVGIENVKQKEDRVYRSKEEQKELLASLLVRDIESEESNETNEMIIKPSEMVIGGNSFYKESHKK
ncbi:RAD25 [Ecytonucleospora hepatopenaei]|uniref:DNA 3'-5' helicase n=1 Tax=Ecytonucleospora hepatopenaei TaxID=646526 RepID=A0A1W0E6L4_9MICR|nr:RAD25 [Ecytonucleospora hepatopenaei]